MSELTKPQTAYLDAFDAGARWACSHIRTKLYYIPESWKTDETYTLYNIIEHALTDIEQASSREREADNG